MSSKRKIVIIDNKNIYESKEINTDMNLDNYGYFILKEMNNKHKNKYDLFESIIKNVKTTRTDDVFNLERKNWYSQIPKNRFSMEEKKIDFMINYFGNGTINNDIFGWNSEQLYVKNTSNRTFNLITRFNDDESKDYFFENYLLKPGKTLVLSIGGIGLEEILYSEFSEIKTIDEINNVLKSKKYKNNEKKIIKFIKENNYNSFNILNKMFFETQNLEIKNDHYGVSF